jgi:hypothetical protein
MLGAPNRVQPNRPVELRRLLEDRPKARFGKRRAEHVRVDEAAGRAKLPHRPLGFFDGRVRVVHRQIGDERREAVAMPRAHVGQRVVRDSRDRRALRRLAERLDRRVRQRQDLHVVIEAVDEREASVKVDQRADASPTRNRGAPHRQALEIRRVFSRREMSEHIDRRHPTILTLRAI